MRDLLHGGNDEAFDSSVVFARHLAESFGARLHVLYTAGRSAVGGLDRGSQRGADAGSAPGDGRRSPRAAGALIPKTNRNGSASPLALRTGPAAEELVRYTTEHNIDLAIVQARAGRHSGAIRAGAARRCGRCAVLVLRPGRVIPIEQCWSRPTRAAGSRWRSTTGRSAGTRRTRAGSSRSSPFTCRSASRASSAASRSRSRSIATSHPSSAPALEPRATTTSGTWIDDEIIASYCALHAAGLRTRWRPPGRTIGWSAASTASRSAARSSASRCSTPHRCVEGRPRGAGRSAARARVHAARHAVGHTAPRAIRRDRGPARGLSRDADGEPAEGLSEFGEGRAACSCSWDRFTLAGSSVDRIGFAERERRDLTASKRSPASVTI